LKQNHNLASAQIDHLCIPDTTQFSHALTSGNITNDLVEAFQHHIYDYYKNFGRTFPWRQTTNPYHIVVSEIMLQQTQTYRVQGKFEHFVEQFPNFYYLAHASMRDLLAAWQGLGYNRRALALQNIAKRVVTEFGGVLPEDPTILETFPGIGPNTAGSIGAFAFNKPTVFIETNIRSVLIHFFFSGQVLVHDKMLLPLIAKMLDTHNPRAWYYALMDYGVALKKMYPNPSRKSVHYTRQSKFEGSDRQVREAILRLLTIKNYVSYLELQATIEQDSERLARIIQDLVKDGFITIDGSMVALK
jgi:A/G-specific adenine glycosylase